MRAFTQHSLACGVLARSLAASGNIRNTEQMFVSGLLHDIGRLVIFKYYPQVAGSMLAGRSAGATSLVDTEKKTLGFRHTDIAADLFEKWKFPVTLIQNVVSHHRPSTAQDPIKAGIIHLADMIVHSLGEGKSGEWRLPILDTAVWDKLRLSPQALSAIIPQAIQHLDFLSTVFQPGD
jgi:putative nucleotidyltransferase with HDIG domain